MAPDTEYDDKKCTTCGAIVPPETEECPECGQPFNGNENLWEEDLKEKQDKVVETIIKEQNNNSNRPLYLGFFLIIVGVLAIILSWYPFGDSSQTLYDMITGGGGTVITAVGVFLLFKWKNKS